MAARKDDGQKPPQGGRRGVIWRLPVSRDADEPPNDEAEPPRRGRRVPLSVVAGLVVALVCVGLYAAWSEVGRDMLSERQAPESAAPAAQAVDAGGDGATGAGAATPPSGDGEATPLAVAEAGEDDSGGAAPAEHTAPVVVSEVGSEADVSAAAAEPLVVAQEDSGAELVVDEEAPASAAAAASARDDETTSDRVAAKIGADAGVDMSAAAVAAASADDAPLPLANNPAETSAAADRDANALDALQARLDALESDAAGASGGAAAVAALEQRIRALEDDPARAQFDRALAAWAEQRAAQDAALTEMAARLATFEATAAQQAADDGRLVSLVLATGELSAALGSSRPFAAALDGLSAIAGEDPEVESLVARLAPFAATGVPTLDGLRAHFPQAAIAIVRAAPAADDADWIDETVSKLSQLVTVRRTGGAIDPESLDGRLAVAEAALAAGDLALALAIVEALMPGSAEAESAHAWLNDARARREADDALAGLVATVRARIGARWTQAGVPP